MRAGDDELAGELLDELEEIDPLRAPLSRPPESYTDFITDYRRAQTAQNTPTDEAKS